MVAHMAAMLPGVRMNVDPEPGPDRGAFQIGSERYRLEAGVTEYVLLARLTAGDRRGARPAFLFCGQRAITNQAATRYLARHHEKLARKHGNNSFVLLLKVVNSQGLRPGRGRTGRRRHPGGDQPPAHPGTGLPHLPQGLTGRRAVHPRYWAAVPCVPAGSSRARN
ncbi:hypothetical protein RKD48_001494 [Streptomyces ambofaciens]